MQPSSLDLVKSLKFLNDKSFISYHNSNINVILMGNMHYLSRSSLHFSWSPFTLIITLACARVIIKVFGSSGEAFRCSKCILPSKITLLLYYSLFQMSSINVSWSGITFDREIFFFFFFSFLRIFPHHVSNRFSAFVFGFFTCLYDILEELHSGILLQS